MLDRYKKKGGFLLLLQLLETSSKLKREQFLGLIYSESVDWERALRSKLLNIDRIYSWDSRYLCEVLSRVPPNILACALYADESVKIERILSCLPPLEARKISNLVASVNPSNAEKNTCIVKILIEARELIRIGILRLEKFDPEIAVPENIEESLEGNRNGSFCNPKTDIKTVGDDLSNAKAELLEERVPLEKELEELKGKLVSMSAEVDQLKFENNSLKNKLNQIKKLL